MVVLSEGRRGLFFDLLLSRSLSLLHHVFLYMIVHVYNYYNYVHIVWHSVSEEVKVGLVPGISVLGALCSNLYFIRSER